MGLVPIFCLCFSYRQTGKVRTFPDRMSSAQLQQLIEPLIVDLGLELVGIEFNSGAGGGLLRVYIDEPERGVGIEDCERASREISALLDVNDPIAGRYTLEVSSPGLERPLFTLDHYRRFVGEQVKITVSLPLDGRRRFQGAILAVEGDHISLDQDGKTAQIAHANVAKAHLVPDYAALGLGAAKPGKTEGSAKPAKSQKPTKAGKRKD